MKLAPAGWIFAAGAAFGVAVAMLVLQPGPDGREPPRLPASGSSPSSSARPDLPRNTPLPARTTYLPTDDGDEAASRRAREDAISAHEARWKRDGAANPRAVAVEEKIVSAAASPGVASARHQPTHFGAECRSSMCRIETRFAPGTDGNQWAVRLLLSLGGQVGSSTIVADRLSDGAQTLVLYAYRPGRAPPR